MLTYLFDFSLVKLRPTRRKITRRVMEKMIVIASEIICILSALN